MGTRTVPQTSRRRGPLMRWIVRSSRAFVAVAVFSLASTGPLLAQGVTTSAVAGIATDSTGVPVEGARVVAVHVPSGTTYAGVTRADGRFTIPGMRVGGPYRVSVAQVGYRPEIQNGINLTLGVTSDVRFVLAHATVELTPITITAPAAGSVFSSARTGPATTGTTQPIARPPTINRRVA